MKKILNLVLPLAVVAAIFGLGFVIFNSNPKEIQTNQKQNAADLSLIGEEQNNLNSQNMQTQQNEQSAQTGLRGEILKPGSGQEVKAGDVVSVHYVGTLENGQKFDSSIDRGQPFEFTLGAGQVIRGWDVGVAGMKVGEKRKLIIPSDLAYGASGAGGVIPPNATLIFEIELLAIK
jgi:peptidylprolyl isomerase